MLFIVRRCISHYEVLKLRPNATPSEIKKAYRKLAKEHHPDVSQGDDYQFKLINMAYQTLKDENKRRLYDLSISNTSFSGEGEATTAEQPGRYGRQDYYKNRWYEGRKPEYENLRDEYNEFMEKNAEKVWLTRLAKVLLAIICFFGYHALTDRIHPNEEQIDKNKKVIEEATKYSEVYLGKLPLNYYIQHRSKMNKVY